MSPLRIYVDHGSLQELGRSLPALDALFRPLSADLSTGTCIEDSNVIVFPYLLKNVHIQMKYVHLTTEFVELVRNIYGEIIHKKI